MDRLERIINNLNFRKIFKIYILLSIILLAICFSSIVYFSRDKISMLIDYKKASDVFEDTGVSNKLENQLNKLASDSKDIVNVFILDKNNNVVFKTSNNLINDNTKVQFTPYQYNRKYLQDNINSNIIYKVVKDDNMILNPDYIDRDKRILSDIANDLFYERDLGNKQIYLLNYIVKVSTGNKIFVIRDVNPIPYAERLLEITGTIFGIILLLYWIGLALWVYKDANRRQSNPSLWGLIVLVTNLVGLLVYVMYKQNSRICYTCGTIQSKENIYCVNCGSKINDFCSKCGAISHKGDKYCANCGNKL